MLVTSAICRWILFEPFYILKLSSINLRIPNLNCLWSGFHKSKFCAHFKNLVICSVFQQRLYIRRILKRFTFGQLFWLLHFFLFYTLCSQVYYLEWCMHLCKLIGKEVGYIQSSCGWTFIYYTSILNLSYAKLIYIFNQLNYASLHRHQKVLLQEASRTSSMLNAIMVV